MNDCCKKTTEGTWEERYEVFFDQGMTGVIYANIKDFIRAELAAQAKRLRERMEKFHHKLCDGNCGNDPFQACEVPVNLMLSAFDQALNEEKL